MKNDSLPRSGKRKSGKAVKIPGGLAPFWMLNDASTVAEKLEFMRQCHAGGINMLTMHPRAGNLIPFASNEWFVMIKALVEEGARLGMKIWLYDEDPYPSGAAGGLVMAERPDLIARAMAYVAAPPALKSGDLWHIGSSRVLWAGLAPLKPGLEARHLTADVGPLRTDWFAVDWDSRYYYHDTPRFPCVRGATVRMVYALRVPEIPTGYQLAAVVEKIPGIDGPWGSLPDLINPETFNVFARLGLNPYVKIVGKHFGTTIPGIFTDEAKAHGATPFTGDLFTSFKKRFGYDLRQNLYRLFGAALDDTAVRTRIDYRFWIRDRFLAGFTRPYAKWCDDHNLHLVGHFSPEDDPIEEAICLPACMPIMQTMGLPGCDVIVPSVGDQQSPTLNLGSLRVSSVKSQLGKPYGCSETQGLNGWDITSRKTRQIYAWQKALGIDRFFTHGFFNSNDGITNYEAPPDYGPRSSIFRGTCAVSNWLARCDAITDGGHEVADVAILDNVFSYWKWAPGIEPGQLQQWRHAWWHTILHCLQAHVGIHAIYTDDAAAATLSKAGLKIGQRTYTTVLVPMCGNIEASVLKKLEQAVAAGVRVVWFGNGPRQVFDTKGLPRPITQLPGTVLRTEQPTPAWCRANLQPQATLKGSDNSDIYLRRFRGVDGKDHLLAVNITEASHTVTLANEPDGVWTAASGLVDGDAVPAKTGLRWEVPPMGCGLFTLAKTAAGTATLTTVRALAGDITFKRLSPNTLRLDACTITLKGRPPQQRPYPEPFWQRFNAYQATETIETFAGVMPIISTVAESDLRYAFAFASTIDVAKAELVLDPRALRGQFDIWCNGRALASGLSFPLPHITPMRLPLTIKKGDNVVELRFTIANALEGVLAKLAIAGEFGVTLCNGQAVVTADNSGKVSPQGWLDMSMAHYMGDGLYQWHEDFNADELRDTTWHMALDGVTDSAKLEINGLDQGTQAWAPWRWQLQGLKAGTNTFTLTVSSTAGNAIALQYPAQPQGWFNGGKLLIEKKRPAVRK